MIYLCGFFLFLASYNFGMMHGSMNQEPAINDLTSQIVTLQQELTRCDDIMSMVFAEWDRSSPVFSKTVEVTCYTSREQETDSTPHITASNEHVRPGGVAVSRDLLEQLGGFGSEVVLQGYGTFEVTDVMNKRFTNSVDIWCGDLEAARLHGRREAVMMWQ